jgi:TonB family protein
MSFLLALLLAAAPATAAPATPTVPLHRLITNGDYPAAAIRAEEQGTVRVALDVSPQGRVTGCTILASSGSSILDSSTCRILYARARFAPARDAASKAVADRFETTITWRMGAAAPQVPPAVQAAMTAWSECIGPTLAKGVGNKALSARALAEQAFLPCRAQEDRMLAAIAGALSAPAPSEKERAALREQVVSRIEAARAAGQRQAPAKANPN